MGSCSQLYWIAANVAHLRQPQTMITLRGSSDLAHPEDNNLLTWDLPRPRPQPVLPQKKLERQVKWL